MPKGRRMVVPGINPPAYPEAEFFRSLCRPSAADRRG